MLKAIPPRSKKIWNNQIRSSPAVLLLFLKQQMTIFNDSGVNSLRKRSSHGLDELVSSGLPMSMQEEQTAWHDHEIPFSPLITWGDPGSTHGADHNYSIAAPALSLTWAKLWARSMCRLVSLVPQHVFSKADCQERWGKKLATWLPGAPKKPIQWGELRLWVWSGTTWEVECKNGGINETQRDIRDPIEFNYFMGAVVEISRFSPRGQLPRRRTDVY